MSHVYAKLWSLVESGPCQRCRKSFRCGAALANARATDVSLDLFSSPTVREG